MKWLIVSLILVVELSAQNYTCADIAKMDNVTFNNLLRTMKQNIVIKYIKKKDIQAEQQYIDRFYNKSMHNKKCLDLRVINTENVESLKRAVALSDLNKVKLNAQEKAIYSQKFSENIRYFSIMSKTSFVSKNLCGYKLIYLSGKKIDFRSIVYEKRLIKGKIKTFKVTKNTDKLYALCGNNDAKNNYINHLSKKGVVLNSFENIDILDDNIDEQDFDIYHPNKENIYIVKKPFKAVKVASNGKRKITIPKNSKLIYLKSNREEIFFKYKNIQYRATKKYFNKGVKND